MDPHKPSLQPIRVHGHLPYGRQPSRHWGSLGECHRRVPSSGWHTPRPHREHRPKDPKATPWEGGPSARECLAAWTSRGSGMGCKLPQSLSKTGAQEVDCGRSPPSFQSNICRLPTLQVQCMVSRREKGAPLALRSLQGVEAAHTSKHNTDSTAWAWGNKDI